MRAAILYLFIQMLASPVQPFVRWSEDGSAIEIVDAVKFAALTLPAYFKVRHSCVFGERIYIET